jgi:hypothetical protein
VLQAFPEERCFEAYFACLRADPAIVDGGVADLLDKERICFGGELFGEGFAFLFESFEADFQNLMQVELLFKGSEELGGCSGFA